MRGRNCWGAGGRGRFETRPYAGGDAGWENGGGTYLWNGGDGMTDWERCPAVERRPGKLSGAWTFAGTRVPVSALFENLESGATVGQFLDWFPGVEAWQVRAVLEHEAEALRVPARM